MSDETTKFLFQIRNDERRRRQTSTAHHVRDITVACPVGVNGNVAGFRISYFIRLFFLVRAVCTEDERAMREKNNHYERVRRVVLGGGGSNRVTRLAGVRSGAPPFYGFSLGIDPDARECRRRRQQPPLPWGK